MIKEGWQYTNLKDIEAVDWQDRPLSVDDYDKTTDFDVCIIDGALVHSKGDVKNDRERVIIRIDGKHEKPIQIMQVLTHVMDKVRMSSIIQIDFVKGADACVHFSYDYTQALNALIYTDIFITLDEGAKARFYWDQHTKSDVSRFNKIHVDLNANSHYESLTLAQGLKLDRVDTEVHFNGEYASANLYGYFHPKQKQQSNHYIKMFHHVGHCRSMQYYKGIGEDDSTGVFSSHVLVEKGADGSDTIQKNKNVLLSDKAAINSLPILEIYADDVSCAHGATVGDLDEQALFYLRSRGVNVDEAKAVLLEAFAEDILSLKEHFDV